MRSERRPEGLTFDSLNAVDFPIEVEDEFELSVPDDDDAMPDTVGKVVNYVLAHAGTRASRRDPAT